MTNIATIYQPTLNADYLPVRVFLPHQVPRRAAEAKNQAHTRLPDDSVEGKALIDSGSLGGDFLSGDMLQRLQGEKFVYRTINRTVVCSGLDNSCYDSSEVLDIGIEFYGDDKIKKIIFLKCRIFPLSKVDLIIGRPTIKRYKLSQINSSHFENDIIEKPSISEEVKNPITQPNRKINNRPSWETVTNSHTVDRPSALNTRSSLTSKDTMTSHVCLADPLIRETPTCTCHHCPGESLVTGGDAEQEVRRWPLSTAERLEPGVTERFAETCEGVSPKRPFSADTQQSVIATLTEDVNTYSREAIAPDEIDDETVDTFAPFLPDPTPAEKKPYFLDEITIEGDEELQLAIRSLCTEFRHIFSDTLGEHPADIPPFKIEVKKSEWETHKNSAPVRPQTAKKEAEIAKHIDSMLRSGVIEPSSAHYWNHPVMVAKPDGTTRFCIDFRALNACSQPGTFPLLVIAATLL